ncbi:MAG: YkgJ family cysteine cluster protein [Phycisphaerae bacterium]|nr:YkgJ family cysteine cluster protein [Phycisphaerae bacterium]
MTHHANLPHARIRELAGDPRFLSAVHDFYERLERQIAAHHPVCRTCSRCCRFGEFGHKLFVTPVELAFFLGTVGEKPEVVSLAEVCPYQVGNLCRAHESRPLGCRVFFCESSGAGWQEGLTESALVELRDMHEHFCVPYAYAEWLETLRIMRDEG